MAEDCEQKRGHGGQSVQRCYECESIHARNSQEEVLGLPRSFLFRIQAPRTGFISSPRSQAYFCLIRMSEIMSLNAVCHGILRLHTDVLAVGGCAETPSSAKTSGDSCLISLHSRVIHV